MGFVNENISLVVRPLSSPEAYFDQLIGEGALSSLVAATGDMYGDLVGNATVLSAVASSGTGFAPGTVGNGVGELTSLLRAEGTWTVGAVPMIGIARIPTLLRLDATASATWNGSANILNTVALTSDIAPFISWVGSAIVTPLGSVVGYANFGVGAQEIFVTNLATGYTTQYTNYAANSFAVIGGVLYLCLDDGLYAVGGTTDAGSVITGTAEFAPTDLGGELGLGDRKRRALKRFDSVGLYIRETGDFDFGVEIDEVTRRTTTVDTTLAPAGAHSRRVRFGRKLRGRAVKSIITSTNAFDLEAIEHTVVITPHNVR